VLVFGVCTAAVPAYSPQALQRAWRTPQLLWLALAAGLTNVCFNMALAGAVLVLGQGRAMIPLLLFAALVLVGNLASRIISCPTPAAPHHPCTAAPCPS